MVTHFEFHHLSVVWTMINRCKQQKHDNSRGRLYFGVAIKKCHCTLTLDSSSPFRYHNNCDLVISGNNFKNLRVCSVLKELATNSVITYTDLCSIHHKTLQVLRRSDHQSISSTCLPNSAKNCFLFMFCARVS